jgi:hypothetical protein
VDRGSLRDQLLSSIRFAVGRERQLMRRILKLHTPDDELAALARKVVEHLELGGFEIDEQERVMRKRDGGRGWPLPPSVA